MQNRYYMKDEVPFSDFPVYTEKSGRRPNVGIVFLVLFLIIAAILGGLYFLGKTRKSQPAATVTPTTAPTPTEAPSPSASASGTLTPSPSASATKLDRSKLSVAVLNGSGVRGAANATAATLRNLGYNVGVTGNAAKFTYTGITILVKKAKSNYGDQLKTDLQAPGATVTTDDTIATDAVVIVGK